jgi:hypothetical protein
LASGSADTLPIDRTAASMPSRIPATTRSILEDRDTLRSMYVIWTETDIAAELRTSPQSVRKALRRMGVDPDGALRSRHHSRARTLWHRRRRAERERQRQRDHRRRREQIALAVAILAVLQRVEREQVDTLADAMRAWAPANGDPLRSFRILLEGARDAGAEFPVAWQAATKAASLDGYSTAVNQTRTVWEACYARTGDRLAFSENLLRD